MSTQKIVVVGAGPVGSLAALYAAQRGHNVEVYELRDDLRLPSTVPLNFTKSINLALSERGINAMRHAGSDKLLQHVFAATIPMRGRMIHGSKITGEFYEESQDYDAHGRTIFAVDRAGLNKRLLDILEEMPNVRILFNHKLINANFKSRKAWFQKLTLSSSKNSQSEDDEDEDDEIEVSFDLLLGADGAHSAVRHHMMKHTQMDYMQEYIDTLWCEFQIQAKPAGEAGLKDPMSRFAISPNHLHIWPGRKFMFIAIPSDDGTFTCTLFMPSQDFETLEEDPTNLPAYFDENFPGVTKLIPPEDLITSFNKNPHLPLINIKCTPYHATNSVVILGDAAHAMCPFYGQGMNAGMEDVRVLFSILDKHSTSAPSGMSFSLESALQEYTATRRPNAHAINDLALQNYVEMRAGVLDRGYRIRKALEEWLSVHVPGLGWETKYSRVSFSNMPYSEVVAKTERQGAVLKSVLRGLGMGLVGSILVGVWRWRMGGPHSGGGSVWLDSLKRVWR